MTKGSLFIRIEMLQKEKKKRNEKCDEGVPAKRAKHINMMMNRDECRDESSNVNYSSLREEMSVICQQHPNLTRERGHACLLACCCLRLFVCLL